MTQKRIKMKSVAPPAETQDRSAVLVEQFLQDNDYLPARGDQSWREQAALRIAASYEQTDEVHAPDVLSAQDERNARPELGGRGGGGVVVAFLAAAIVVPAIAVLSAPDILTADFWSAHRASPKAMARPGAAMARMPDNATHLRASLAKIAPAPNPALAKGADRDLGLRPATNSPPQAARPVMEPHDKTEGGDAGKFRTLVVGTDGSMTYEYFSPRPSAPMARREAGGIVAKGFYAMVPDQNGTLQYKYFPSKPVR